MAQAPAFATFGGANITKGTVYVKSDLPDTTINKMRIAEAPRIWRKVRKEDGTVEKGSNGKDKITQGKDRGVWILITRTGASYSVVLPNAPTLYKENEEIVIHADNTYQFLADCNIEYGVV